MNFIDNEITREPEAKERKPKEQQLKEEPTRAYQKKTKEPIFDIKKTTTTLFDEEDYEVFFGV